MKQDWIGDFVGEFFGTLLLVFFGCSTVAATVLFGAHVGLMQVALSWGVAVTLSIYASRHLSCAHLNPAVSLAMVCSKRMRWRKLPTYLLGQFLGAFAAAALVYAVFGPSITQFEWVRGIVRGSAESKETAMIFGEFFPNPSLPAWAEVTVWNAFFSEAIGTAFLVLMVFSLTEKCNVGRPDEALSPLFIGATVTLIIAVLAPITQAGLNPARDLSPRLFAAVAGWGEAAFPQPAWSFLSVYVAGPMLGALVAAVAFTQLMEPLARQKNDRESCC
ncbi:MAG: MIP/aquaporin family protein [bacterium]|nr:MIP/aquaporin family protein [bacterium]